MKKGADRLVDRPANVGVRLIALDHLADAEAARLRLRENADPEALHDFRVALRRLRSTVRAYPAELEDSVRGKDRKRLKALARATGESRDREVQLEAVERFEPVDTEEADAIAWLAARLVAAKQEADAGVNDVVERGFPQERARLERRLARYCSELDLERPDVRGPSTGELAAGLVTVLGATLEARLAAIHDVQDQAGAHRARIAGKRLRYALEPFRPEVPIAARIVERLRKLQDQLGEMHDAHVLGSDIALLLDTPATRDEPPRPEPGLRRLAERCRIERDRYYEALRTEWMGRDVAPFFDDVRAAARQLRARGRRAETQRRFLLHGMPSLLRWRTRSVRIDEGWLPGDTFVERIRRERTKDRARYTRSVLAVRDRSRVELEEELSKEEYLPFWRLTRGRRVRKRRYVMDHEGLGWEIDRFLDRDLVIARVEPPDADTPISIPPWLEPFVDREITSNDEYDDTRLAG